MTEDKEHISPIVGEIEDTSSLKLLNWNGFGVIVGNGHNASILDEIQHRRKDIKQNMILICGAPGEGKSYFALRLAQIFDTKFNPQLQIVFERTHLLWLLSAKSPLAMGQVILIDEAQFIAGARRWYEEIQKDIMEHIEAIRSRGFIIIVVALHINLLDKVIRQYVLSEMMSMSSRGRAQVYELWTPTFSDKLFKRKVGRLALQLPDIEKCEYPNCLICKFQDRCMTLRAVYERLKKQFLGKMSAESRHRAELKDQKKYIDINDLLTKTIACSKDFAYAKNGIVEVESVKMILEKQYSLVLGDAEVRRIVKRGLILHPSIFQKPKEVKENGGKED